MAAFSISTHGSYPPEETALVDSGLGASNEAAAPLHEVQPISCFARAASGEVLGVRSVVGGGHAVSCSSCGLTHPTVARA